MTDEYFSRESQPRTRLSLNKIEYKIITAAVRMHRAVVANAREETREIDNLLLRLERRLRDAD